MSKKLLLCVFMTIGLFTATAPTFATDQSTAVELCKKNPSCGLIRGKGGVGMWIDKPGGGTSEVWCPDSGPCTCIVCRQASNSAWGNSIGHLIRKFEVPDSLTGSSSAASAPRTAPGNAPSAPPVQTPTTGNGGVIL